MLKLYQREDCLFCAKIRAFLNDRGLSFAAINVPKLGSERHDVLALSGITTPEVPVLVDGDKAIQNSEAIFEHLGKTQPEGNFGDPSYGLTRTLKGVGFSDAIASVKKALSDEGFGVLTEIDVRATMKKKLDVDFRNYNILGACNPPLAYKALSTEPAVGLLLPCNVVVTEDEKGNAIVSALDPRKQFSLINRPDLEPVATDVGGRVRRVLAALPSNS